MSEAGCNGCPYHDLKGRCKLNIYSERGDVTWHWLPFWSSTLAPYADTPCRVVRQMLSLAKLNPNEVVYDLGSGDGRILILAAGMFGAKAIGYELDEELANGSLNKVRSLHLQNRVKIIQEDLLNADLCNADVVTMYLSPKGNQEVKPKLERELKPGTRVVSLEFDIPGWKPNIIRKILADNLTYTIYVYKK